MVKKEGRKEGRREWKEGRKEGMKEEKGFTPLTAQTSILKMLISYR